MRIRTKECFICNNQNEVLYRCRYDEFKNWVFLCGTCLTKIKFGIIPPLRYIQLIDKKDKFNVRIQLTGFFNKPVKQIEKYINDELMHLVIKK